MVIFFDTDYTDFHRLESEINFAVKVLTQITQIYTDFLKKPCGNALRTLRLNFATNILRILICPFIFTSHTTTYMPLYALYVLKKSG
jgi:hypothetical protein